VRICSLCFRSFEKEISDSSQEDICSICANPQRDHSLISLVEKEVDLESIEETKTFKGLYFVLGGLFRGRDEEDKKINQRIEQLVERVKKDQKIKEIILALNPTLEGRNTSLLIERRLRKAIPEERELKTTHLACGLPKGGELEYADEETISSALENRK
jgi:recombination protein RecR